MSDRPETSPIGVDPTRARPAQRRALGRRLLSPADLMAPMLVQAPDRRLGNLPGTVTLDEVGPTIKAWADLGLAGAKIFVSASKRDAGASGGTDPRNLMVLAIEEAKAAAPDFAICTEVCACSWTDTGECFIGSGPRVDRDATFGLYREMALLHAQAGVDIASPTAMLDGAIRSVREALDAAQFRDVGVCPNVAVNTVLYGPFKAAMGTDPKRGDRRGFQLEADRADRDAVVIGKRWLAEGADSLTLQPVMTAVDVLIRLRAAVSVPLVAYSTSGEYAPLEAMGVAASVEYHSSLKRAGADLILTFAAESLARHLSSTTI